MSAYEQWRRAAAGDARPASDFEDNYANNASDGLFFSPGVYVNALDINEPRIVLRGFAIGNRQERSTVPVFRDGAPLTDVHGTTNVHEIDLLAVSRIEVLRGGGGDLRLSGDNLGGAVNFISPTGLENERLAARIDGGAAITGAPSGRAHAEVAGVSSSGRFDYFASVSGLYEEGIRDNNRRNSEIFNGNLGIRISPTVSTRFFFEAIHADTELAGGLFLSELLADPGEPMPALTIGPLFPGGPIIELADGARSDDFARNIFVGRVSNQTDFRLFAHSVALGFHYARRDIVAPQIDFVGILDESGGEWGANLALSRDTRFFNMDASYRIGGAYSTGTQDSDRYENLNSFIGNQFVDSEHNSANVNGFIEAMLKPLKKLAVNIGAKFIMVDREITNLENDDFEERRFTGVAARGGVLYDVTKNFQVFANAARTYEPPSLSELISDDPESLNDLDEQDAFTYEVGMRGRHRDWLGWDITLFNTDVENEIINIDEPETNGLGALVNAPSTTHKGAEVGLNINLIPTMTARNGRALTVRSAYSYNDFRFDDAGPIDNADGNRLAGIPQHVLRGELRYDEDGRWYVAANVQVAAGEFYADHENLVSVPTYAVIGFNAGLRLSEQLEIFASGENITDVEYAAGVTPVASQATQNGRIFTPGARASVYGGLRYRF